jgi:hypothetical protein
MVDAPPRPPRQPDIPTGIYGALAAAAGEMKAIEKDQQNTGQGFKFRSIETIVAAAKPILAKHEISIVPTSSVSRHEEVTSSGGNRGWRCIVEMTWQISHADGSFIVGAQSGEAVDYGDKSTSKASQMAYKYLLTQMLGIGSEDPDGETADVGEVVSPEDQVKLRTNAVKAAVLKETEGDADAAQSLWDGVLDSLGYQEPLKESQLKKVEAALNDLPEVEPS